MKREDEMQLVKKWFHILFVTKRVGYTSWNELSHSSWSEKSLSVGPKLLKLMFKGQLGCTSWNEVGPKRVLSVGPQVLKRDN